MIDITTATLCDFAQVRERLLMVSSGAITRLYRQQLPATLAVMVAVVVAVPLEDTGDTHTLIAEVVNRNGHEVAEGRTAFTVGNEDLFPHEVQQIPLVLSLAQIATDQWGTHQVRLSVDDGPTVSLTFYLVPIGNPGSASDSVATNESIAANDSQTNGSTRVAAN